MKTLKIVMKKQLEAQLMSLAHQILRRKDKADTLELKEFAKDAYEALSILHFTETHFGSDSPATQQEVIDRMLKDETLAESYEKKPTPPKSLEETLFEEPPTPIFVKSETEKIAPEGIQIDGNQRLTFVNHLFSGSQEDYLRVLSMLNTKQTVEQALEFLTHVVKPDYNNWENKEVYESQFTKLIKLHFES